MTDFFWVAGHLGWGFFALLIFSGLWLLASDLVWRLKNTRIVRLAAVMGAGWVVGVVLIAILVRWVG